MANRHTIRLLQFLSSLGVPRIGGDGEATAPISESQAQSKDAQQTNGREYKGLDMHKIELLVLRMNSIPSLVLGVNRVLHKAALTMGVNPLTLKQALVSMIATADTTELQERVRELKKLKNAGILAHNYQVPELQDVADFVGDSLGLSFKAKETAADVILFCGVHFMAETAKIVNPGKTVILPDLEAGCSLADSCDAKQLAKWKEAQLNVADRR